MIKQCDAVFANLMPFRGTEPDSGTVFEVGFAIALDKLVFGYNIPECTYKESVVKILSLEENSDVDRNGHSIENFGHWGNLMLAYSVFNCGTLEGCCRELNYQMRIR
jgi:nucleoside 2-deoxyribosyltransferase